MYFLILVAIYKSNVDSGFTNEHKRKWKYI